MASPDVNSKTPHAWEVVGDVMVTWTVSGAITDDLWNRFLADLRRAEVRAIFAMVVGESTLSPTQRRDAAVVMKEKNIPANVITDSALTRGILTAMSWLGAKTRGYSWDKFEKGADELDTAPQVRSAVVERARAFKP